MRRRRDLTQREDAALDPYAMRSASTRGRVHPEPEDEHRSPYRRDHDRIIHSSAFRRLEYKTQVFVNHEGDYYRTRLTHTLEVAQIASALARLLGLNEDLVEAMALAHDLGHPPFGHAGEEALRELMAGHGGFDHNLHGLRIVDLLEERYPAFPGLNLSYEVREGINKHRTPFDEGTPQASLNPEEAPLLEGQVVDIADEIAYDNHDLDDGITSGLITEVQLHDVPLWREAHERVTHRYPQLKPEIRKYQIIRSLINQQILDLAEASEARLRRLEIRSVEDVRRCTERLVAFSPPMTELRKPLKAFLWHHLYQHYRVVRMSDKAKRFIRELFLAYLTRPEQLPDTTRTRLTSEEPHRVICDYIAGMTDRYALNEYQKLFDPYTRV